MSSVNNLEKVDHFIKGLNYIGLSGSIVTFAWIRLLRSQRYPKLPDHHSGIDWPLQTHHLAQNIAADIVMKQKSNKCYYIRHDITNKYCWYIILMDEAVYYVRSKRYLSRDVFQYWGLRNTLQTWFNSTSPSATYMLWWFLDQHWFR